MASLFSLFLGLLSPAREVQVSSPPPRPPTSPVPPPGPTQTLPAVKNWSHPFKEKSNPLLQLTQMAKAAAGYYPLGRNGLWHGGVHFDNGTAGTLDQSAVHCLADGEVVAYRIDEHSPTTNYFVNKLCVPMPFSRNFVLVRHRLEAPKIEGSTDAPPSLIFYSLYMHLQDWAIYRDDASIPRPGFWPEAEIRRIKAAGVAGERGHRVYGHPRAGEALGLLPAGTEVTVSGEGEYRKLKNTNGPDILKNADGSLRGYVAFEHLVPIAGDEYRVSVRFTLNIRAEPSAYGEILMCLTNGTEVAVSGEGKFRKLERVNQYVDYDSLEEAREPIADRIVVPDKPVAIKAGDLIGHIGEYQDQGAEHPEKKLHLEVFSDDPVDLFIKASRAWAQRLPDTGKTWLKLAKGAAVVAHQAHFSTTRPPTLNAANTPSDADLLVPKSLIDGLSAENKIVIAATAERAACNWYRLDGLLHDENCVPLDGWVREEVGVTPWISPWSWDGYDVIYNYDPPRQTLASFLRAMGRFTEEQLERHGNLADLSDQGVMRKRLYDIIDRDCNGKMTAEELQAAISLPALAQSLSQLIIRYESEWRHTPRKWDALDEVLGHSGSTPLLNWVAEKERIREISWWNEVEERIGLPVDGKVYHFHPVGLISHFAACNDRITLEMLKAANPEGDEVHHRKILPYLNKYAISYLLEQPRSIAHFLSQVAHESGFRVVEEELRFSARQMKRTYGCKMLNSVNGYNVGDDSCDFGVLRSKLWTEESRYAMNAENLGSYVYANRMGNGDEASKEGYKYRGRGMLQVTGKAEYQRFTRVHNHNNPTDIQDFVKEPDLLVSSVEYGVESAFVFWFTKTGSRGVKLCDVAQVGSVTDVTKLVNGGQNGLADREARFQSLAILMGL